MRTSNASALLDDVAFNRFHFRVLFWCALIIIFDGYDLVIYGVVLPSLMSEWGLSALQAGLLGSCALVGMMFGALFFGSLSDRIGRKKTIATCVLLFSGFTVINGFARTAEEFALCRFLAGLGIGGVMPNVVALMNEYSPRKMRSTLIAVMFSGYSVGGMLSAAFGMVLIPIWGWQSVFFIAAVPLLLLPLIIRHLPESIDFLVRDGRPDQARKTLGQAVPGWKPTQDDRLEVVSGTASKASVSSLFCEGRTVSTLMLWVAFFCCLLMVYALGSWLPKLMTAAGYGLSSSIAFLLVLNLGAIFGAIGGGWIADRVGVGRVVVAFFSIGTLALALLALKSPLPVLYLLIAVAGACTIGTQILANACAVQFYPAQIRSTGSGWAMGVGRLGAIIGPLMGASLHAASLPLEASFLAFAAPGLIGALAIAVFVSRGHNKGGLHRKRPAIASAS